MAYATLADLVAKIPRGEQELIELTDRDASGIVNAARVDDALATATSIADSYLAKVVAVPLSVVPELLQTHVCNLARYELYGDQPTDEVRRRRDDALAWLKDVAAGRADLGLPPESPVQVAPRARRGQVRSAFDGVSYP